VVLWAVARVRKHSAEAGVGKSTLMQALHTRVGREEATWITYRCSPYRTKSALYPITEYLSRALRWQPDESATVKLGKPGAGAPSLPSLHVGGAAVAGRAAVKTVC
jgi:hypothetical protein